MQTVLVVNCDLDICALLRTLFESEGFGVACAPDGASGFAAATEMLPILVLIDVNLPGMNGLKLLQQLRETRETASIPIAMITETASEADSVLAFERGADDYVVRPFRPRELIARMRALIRRSGNEGRTVRERRVGHLSIDSGSHTVRYWNEAIAITHTEFRILDLLVKNAGSVVSREQILHASRDRGDPVLPRSVDVHIRSLRKKLRGGGDLIVTVRAVGYRLKGIDEISETV